MLWAVLAGTCITWHFFVSSCLGDAELDRLTRELHEATDAMHKAATNQSRAQTLAYSARGVAGAATAAAAALKVRNCRIRIFTNDENASFGSWIASFRNNTHVLACDTKGGTAVSSNDEFRTFCCLV